MSDWLPAVPAQPEAEPCFDVHGSSRLLSFDDPIFNWAVRRIARKRTQWAHSLRSSRTGGQPQSKRSIGPCPLVCLDHKGNCAYNAVYCGWRLRCSLEFEWAVQAAAPSILATGRARPNEIEALLADSLEIAREQKARSWELRTACDLARLWQRQDRCEEALSLLQASYDQFNEGLETPDLACAKMLLDQLFRSTVSTDQMKHRK